MHPDLEIPVAGKVSGRPRNAAGGTPLRVSQYGNKHGKQKGGLTLNPMQVEKKP